MLKENWRLISRLEQLGDFLIVIFSFFGAYYGRQSLLAWDQRFSWGLPFGGEVLAPLREYYIVLFIALLGYATLLRILGAYGSMRLSSSLRLFSIAMISSLLVFMLIASLLFLLKLDLSRSFIFLFCCLSGLSITVERYLVLIVLRFWRRRGRNFRNIIICGVGEQALRVAREISQRAELGLRILGFADLRENSAHLEQAFRHFREEMRRSGCQRIGRLFAGKAALEGALSEFAIDEIIFTDVVEVMPQVEDMVVICAEQGIRTTIAADLFSFGLVKSGISYFGSMPLIHFQTPPGDRWELAVKRAFDVVVASALLLLFSPLFLLIALALKVSSAGPAFFAQKRVGLNGRLFKLYKFRSMYLDAEDRLKVLQEQNEMSGPVFKMKDDPRVTMLGGWLRRFSLDELPQLWNVLKGDMSLVGPRPPIPGEVSMYDRKDRRRLSMRPGMTCTWQVSGRNEISDFNTWVKLDLEYIDNWSLTLDFILLCKTIPAVLSGSGAR